MQFPGLRNLDLGFLVWPKFLYGSCTVDANLLIFLHAHTHIHSHTHTHTHTQPSTFSDSDGKKDDEIHILRMLVSDKEAQIKRVR